MHAMNAVRPVSLRRSNAVYRWIRQLHLWIGAWGALAAVIYGFTGLVMNHRFGEGAWPQGESSEGARTTLQVPVAAQSSPERLSLWLREAHGLDAQVIRKGPPGGGRGSEREQASPPKWTLSGGTATQAWSIDYAPGSTSAVMKQTRHDTLAAFNRLHKAVGGGLGWTILADSFALAMLLLGVSGIWMWARGRSAKDLVLSVLAASVLVLALVLGPALA